jgi:NitT/TauT family transport system substrate-binding protein
MPKLFACCLLLAAIALPATEAAAQSKPLKAVSVGIGGRSLITYLPFTLADRLGYFADEGLKVEINDFQGGSRTVEALVGGSVDVAVGAYENVVFLQAKGIEAASVVLFTSKFGFALVLPKDRAASYKSPKDIKALKIGVTSPGSATANALEILLAKDGLTMKDVSVIGIGGGAGAVAAMKSHQIDGMVMSDPVVTRLEMDGDGVSVVDSRTDRGQTYIYGGPSAASSSFVLAKFAREKPDLVQGYVNAVVRTLKWMQKTPVDDIVKVVPKEYLGADPDAYKKSLAINVAGFSKDGMLTAANVGIAYNAIASSGRLPAGKQIDLPRTYMPAFAEAANKKY